MKNLKKGFTLVELIVVITILAILGTIAFISLQGYSSDARNSKRTSDINSIGSQINIKSTEGVSLLAMVTSVTNNEHAVTTFIGGAPVLTGTNYKAGSVVGTALGIKETEFRDPNGDSYVLAVTTKKEGKYEVGASVEVGGGVEAADVVGNYVPRTTATDLTATYATGATSITIASTEIGLLVYGDIVDLDGSGALTATGTVTAVSGDGLSITFTPALPSNAGLKLHTGSTTSEAEPAGLIDAAGATTGSVTDAGSVLPY